MDNQPKFDMTKRYRKVFPDFQRSENDLSNFRDNYIGSHLGYCTERPREKNLAIRKRYCELSNLRGGILHF